jgi:FkbM family methyltransferase
VTPRSRLAERVLDARVEALGNDPPAAAEVVGAETDVGTLLLHAHDRVMTPLIRQRGLWEPDEGAWLRSVLRPGGTVVDCGANIGYFSVLASKAVGDDGAVLAVEPEAANLRLLRANLWRNRCDNVCVLPAAASDARGLLALRRSATNAGDHQVHRDAGPDDLLVPCLALDDLLDGLHVNAIKVDTQGADHLVVAGLRRTLAANRHAPALIEFWMDAMAERGISAADVLAGYRSLGRPLGLLGAAGAVTPATDAEILTAAGSAQDHWVNLVLGTSGGPE